MPRPSPPEKLDYPATRLTADEVFEAAWACHGGDLDARHRLLWHFFPIVVSRAGKTPCRDGVDRNDLIQDVLAEVLRALPRFDPGVGVGPVGVQARLTTFVGMTIAGACLRSPSRQSAVRVPDDGWSNYPDDAGKASKAKAFSDHDRPGRTPFAEMADDGRSSRREALALKAGAVLARIPRAEARNLETVFGLHGTCRGSHRTRVQAQAHPLFPVAVAHAREAAAHLYPEGIDE